MKHRRLLLACIAGLAVTLALLWALSSSQTAQAYPTAVTIHVAMSGSDTVNCGRGIHPPCRTIQYAVHSASPGDSILVATGVYTDLHSRLVPAGYPNPPASGRITQVVYISKSITIIGGYPPNFSLPPNPKQYPTTIQVEYKSQGRGVVVAGNITPTITGLRITGGDAAGLGGTLWGEDGGGGVYVISATATLNDNRVFGNSADSGGGLYLYHSDAVLNGNTVTSNTASSYGGGLELVFSAVTLSGNAVTLNAADSGGGVDLYESAATLNGNTVTSNTASSYGGGLDIVRSTATLSGNAIMSNAADYGGGLELSHSAATLSGNTVTSNTADYGGGVDLYESAATLSENIVTSNTADYGGGLYLYVSDATLTNDVAADNRANVRGSGLEISGSSPLLLHTTIARNSGGDGSGVYVTNDMTDYSTVVMTNTVLVSHTVGISVTGGNTLTLNGVLWHNSPITVSQSPTATVVVQNQHTGDPRFAPDGCHLLSGSAAANRGVSAGVATDIDGDPRDLAPDFGADELRTCWARLNDAPTDYGHVQAAVDASTRPTDVIRIAGYCAGVNAYGGLRQQVYLTKTLTLQGGYTPTNWTTPYPLTQPTTLDAGGQGRVLYISGSTSPTVEGLRITGGNAAGLGGDPWGDDVGGGMYVISATATISNNRVFENSADYGGGLYLYDSAATLNGNTVASNTAAAYGGGMYLRDSAATLSGNIVLSNTAADSGGGGLSLYESDATLNGNAITSNITDHYGGGLDLYYSDATLNGNTVASNTAGWSGGGLYLYHSNATLSGNTVTSNTTASGGGGLYLTDSAATLTGNTVTSNTAAHDGGGLRLSFSDATLDGNIVTSNTAANAGGGLYLYDSDATLNGNTIASNTSNWAGGGLYLHYGDAALNRNTIRLNTAAYYGGGLRIDDSNATLINNVVADNRANASGSGVAIVSHSTPRLLHTTIARNHGGDGSGVYVSLASTVALTNTILVSHTVGVSVTGGNTVTVNGVLWCDTPITISQSPTATISVQNQHTGDPRFASDGYHLLAGSAAANRGVSAGVATDIDGEPRDLAPDLGADEYPCTPVTSVDIAGPASGYTDTLYAFSAVVTPTDATPPVAYTWSPAPTSGQGTSIAAYTWPNVGSHTITLTAENCGGSAVATHAIVVESPPPGCPHPLSEVSIAGPASGVRGAVYTFTAAITPTDATPPVAYTWSPDPQSGQGTSIVAYTWPDAGSHTITLTVENCGGHRTATHTVAIEKSPFFVTVGGAGVACAQDDPCSLPTALSLARDGDTVYVANGVYTGAGAEVIAVMYSIALYGGWDGAPAGPVARDPSAHPTTLDGEHTRRVVYIGEYITPTLDGFVVANGNATDAPADPGRGGGIYSWGATPIIAHNVITGNIAQTGAGWGYGGGVYAVQAPGAVVITGNQVFSNVASVSYFGSGGGIYLEIAPAAQVASNVVLSNTASVAGAGGYGGGIYLQLAPAARVASNVVLSNTASITGGNGYGGGIYFFQNHGAAITGNRVEYNVAGRESDGDGGGVMCRFSDNATLNDNQVQYNTATLHTSGSGGGIGIEGCHRLAVAGNTLLGNVSAPSGKWGRGGGLWVQDTRDLRLDANRVVSNTARWGGGFYFQDGASFTMTNNVVAGNAAESDGGGMQLVAGGGGRTIVGALAHNTFAANGGTAMHVGGDHITLVLTNNLVYSHTYGVYAQTNSTVTLDHTLFYAHTGGDTEGDGLIVNTAPITGHNPLLDADYHLQPGSPAIDAGLPLAWVAMDVDGELRPHGLGYDVGADEYYYQCTPLSGVRIAGPTSGYTDTQYAFSAVVTPATASAITYTWTPAPDSGQGTATARYTWQTVGTKTITVTAQNCGGSDTDTHTVIIASRPATPHFIYLPVVLRNYASAPPACAVPLTGVTISGPTTGYTGTLYSFTANIAPGSAQLPITYQWSPEPSSGQGAATASYQWAATGSKTISVTVSNCAGAHTANDQHTITIQAAPSTSLDVTLTVSNPLSTARQDEPTTSGVPIPRSVNLINLNTLRLLDGGGQPVPAQFTPLARWGGAPGDASKPVRWLLIDFQADVPAHAGATYRLVNSGGAAPAFPTLTVTDSGGAVTINTGVAQFSISKTDGRLAAPHLSAPLYGQARADGVDYTASGPVTVSVKMDGDMRAVVHVEGAYRDAGGAPLLDYTSRYWFYAGQSVVRLFHTVENNTPCPLQDDQFYCHDIGSGGSITFTDVSLVIPTSLGGGLTYQAAGEGTPASGNLSDDLLLYQDSSGTEHWDYYPTKLDWENNPISTAPRMQTYVSFRGYSTTLGSTLVDSGNQAVGRLTLAGGSGTWSVAVRDFWQNFPKVLRATSGGVIEVGLFPDEFGPAGYGFNLRSGEHKTHEILLAPGVLPPLTPLFASAPPAWYVNSGAFDFTALPNWADWAEHEQYIADQLDRSPEHVGYDDLFYSLPDAIEGTDFYGIFDYGDWPIDYEGLEASPLNLKYDANLGMWLQWLRGNDTRWFTLAAAGDRHLADIDVLHTLHSPRHWSDGIIFGHSYHDEEGFVNPHRNYGGTHPDVAYGMPGLFLSYYLTGYEKAYEAALEVADCIEYRVHNDYHLCGDNPFPDSECNGEGYALPDGGLYASGERAMSNNMLISVAAYRATADPRYLVIADTLVDWAEPSIQPYITGTNPALNDPDIHYVKPWQMNMYLRALAGYIEMREEFGLPDTYNARGDLISYTNWLSTYVILPLDPLPSGARAAYPYHWFFDGRPGTSEDPESGNSIPSVNNWLLLGADVMAYAHRLTGNTAYLDRATALFRAGIHDPFYEDDVSMYTESKQTVNSLVFGHIFLYEWAEAQ